MRKIEFSSWILCGGYKSLHALQVPIFENVLSRDKRLQKKSFSWRGKLVDRPKPNVLTLDLVFIYVLTPVGSKLDVLTPGHSDSQPGSCFVYSLQVFPSGTVSTICLFVDLK